MKHQYLKFLARPKRMKISEILAQAQARLHNAHVANPRLDAILLLVHITKFSKEKIIFNPDLEIDDALLQSFWSVLAKREMRQPISQIIGKREFYGRDFIVTSDVLDPRCDSESLIEMVLHHYANKANTHFLEIGCGSGCLSITLLKELQNAKAVAVDISDKALEIAAQNAQLHEVEGDLQLMKSDLFGGLDHTQRFDLIISNPPYIASGDIETLQDEVKNHEPRLALDGGADGLDFYRKIALQTSAFMRDGAKLILEIGIHQEHEISDIFAKEGFILESSKKDLAQVIRNLCFIKNDS